MAFHRAPNILLMLLLCMSGHALSILRRSSRAHTMNAFIGRLMWFGERPPLRAARDVGVSAKTHSYLPHI
jgi:hypothetical protein